MPPTNHFVYLDLIRYVAAITVAIFHYKLSLSESFLNEFVVATSVEIFFVLSGFVLARQINHIIKNGFKFSDIKIFLIRRWLRTIPPYLIALIIAMLIFGGGGYKNVFLHVFYLQNFISDTPAWPFFPVGWSLSIEEWFYVLFPITLFIFYKFKKVRNLNLFVSLGIIILCLILRLNFGSIENWGSDVRRSVIFRFDAIIYGYIAYCIKDLLSQPKTFLYLFLGLGFFLCNLIFYQSLQTSQLSQNFFFISCGLFFSFLLIVVSRISKFSNKTFTKFVFFLAKLSYPIYLFHIIIIAIIKNLNIEHSWAFYICSLHVFAIIFHYGFESPILKARPGFKQRT